MIVVSVILMSAVDGSSQELARAYIDNIGGTTQIGNYRVRTLRGRSTEDFARNTVQREGKVEGHARLREHVWNLVAKALTATGYGKATGQ